MRIIIFFNISKFENLHEIKLWNTSISKQFKSLLTENSESLDPKWSTFNTHRKKEEKTFSSTSCLLWLLLISWNLEPWNLCLLSPPIGLSIPWMPLPLPPTLLLWYEVKSIDLEQDIWVSLQFCYFCIMWPRSGYFSKWKINTSVWLFFYYIFGYR